jgi:hypothetical protein
MTCAGRGDHRGPLVLRRRDRAVPRSPADQGRHGKPLPAVTGKHYNHAQRKNMQYKRRVLYRWATELRRIVGEAEAVDLEQRLAA